MVPREIWEYYNYEQSGNLPTPELKPSSALTRDMITDLIFPPSDIKRFSSVILYRSNLKEPQIEKPRLPAGGGCFFSPARSSSSNLQLLPYISASHHHRFLSFKWEKPTTLPYLLQKWNRATTGDGKLDHVKEDKK